MKLPRRQFEVFTLSFLDCICCGFGAIILLLVLTEYGKPIQIEESREHLKGQVLALTRQLHEIRGDSALLNRELEGREDASLRERMKVDRLAAQLTNIRGQYSASRKDSAVANIVERELVAAYQTLSAEMKRLLAQQVARPRVDVVGGIPIDSEYIVFVVDTSASMNDHWQEAVQIMTEALDLYPKVKGMQIMNDQARLMYERTRGSWLTDSAQQRADILKRMKTWRPFSQSNPVPGITEALRTYNAAGRRIGIYVLGDEFTGDSYQSALTAIGGLNKPDAAGRRSARINAIGFPAGAGMTPFTNVRFSALMRLVCEQNNGTFVGLTK